MVSDETWDVGNSTKHSKSVADAAEPPHPDEVGKSAVGERQGEGSRITDVVVVLQPPLPF